MHPEHSAANNAASLVHTDDLKAALEQKGWLDRYSLYERNLSSVRRLSSSPSPEVSVIVISWRYHPDTLKTLSAVKAASRTPFELIFVNNGAPDTSFASLEPFIDLYVTLNSNTGAYVARNIGAVFARAPVLFFLEDDGIACRNIVDAHRDIHDRYDVISVRGVYRPKTDLPFNRLAHHYYPGDKPFPRYADLEGNVSYRAETFYRAGGWDDTIVFGHGGIDLSFRLLKIDPCRQKQIYAPDPVLYHDFARSEKHLAEKKNRQQASWEYLRRKHTSVIDTFLDSWNSYRNRPELIIPKNKPCNSPDKENPESQESLIQQATGLLEQVNTLADRQRQIAVVRQAIRLLEKARSINGFSSELSQLITDLYKQIGCKEPEEADENLKAYRPDARFVQNHEAQRTPKPAHVEHDHERALQLYSRGLYDELVDVFGEITTPDFSSLVSAGLMHLGRFEDARRYLQRLPRDEETVLKLSTIEILQNISGQRLDKEPRVHILLLSHNRRDCIEKSLQQLAASEYRNYAVFTADNCSTDGAWDVLKNASSFFPSGIDVVSERLITNVGRPAGHNWLLEKYDHSKADFIAIADDDLVAIPPGWLRDMVGLMYRFPGAAVVGGKAVNPDHPRKIHGGVRKLMHFNERELKMTHDDEEIDTGLYDYIDHVDHVIGCLHLYRREALDDIGTFDIRLSPCQYVDIDHHLRTRLKGYEIIYNGLLTIEHLRAMGTKGQSDRALKGNSIGNIIKLVHKHDAAEVTRYFDAEKRRYAARMKEEQ